MSDHGSVTYYDVDLEDSCSGLLKIPSDMFEWEKPNKGIVFMGINSKGTLPFFFAFSCDQQQLNLSFVRDEPKLRRNSASWLLLLLAVLRLLADC
ncbi:hypothetical protein L3X38_022042 [Prunus dulcis]|uniref:Uncharacterized protein n=1 Tax=Prunus dulcis TaxID=3755 RepID=A0AAD4VW75_PRUDU|nr:hypothetical protein L3X38_022042 [Prunus dulcis]